MFLPSRRRRRTASSPVLFKRTAGTALPNGATFTRSTTATYTDVGTVIQTAAINTLRGAPGTVAYLGGSPVDLLEAGATNVLLWCRDLTNAAWTKASVTVAKDQTGADGSVNGACSATATAPNVLVYQSGNVLTGTVTSSYYIKRLSGTGTVSISADGGATYVPVTLTASYQRFQVTATLASQQPGGVIKIATSGDSIAVDFLQYEAGAFATSAIATTSGAVSRGVDALSLPGVASANPATLFYRYYDLATAAFVDVASAYTSGTTITPAVNRGYNTTAVLNGTYTAAAAAVLLGVP